MSENDSYEIIIKPNRSWFYVDWQGLLHYRDLLFLLVRKDFVSKYKQTILGPTWFIIQPLMTTAVFTIIFNRIANLSTDTVPPFLFYLSGLTIWSYFASSLDRTSAALIENAQLFGKVYFPRIIVPLSTIVSNLFTFAIQLLTFLGFYLYFKYFTRSGININPNFVILVLPLLLLQTAAFSLGVGLWISALTAKYRDLRHLMSFLIQLWLYATPVIYPVSTIPEKWKFILFINPMAAITDLFRCAFFGTAPLNISYSIVSIAITLFTLFTGFIIFNKTERTFVDTV